MMPFFNSLDH